MNSTIRNSASILAVVILLMVSLYTISDATSNSATFGKYYNWLIFFNLMGLAALTALIAYNVYKLIIQYRLKTIGSRLTARMIGVFVLLTIIPVSIVYYFSLTFLHRSIDSWFDVGIEIALEDSLKLGRSAVDLRKREALNKTRAIALEISAVEDEILFVFLDDARDRINANELTLVDHDQTIVASSSIDSIEIPTALSLTDLGELDAYNHYLKLEDDPVYGLAIRIVVLVQSLDATEKAKTLQALFPFTDRLNELTLGVQAAFDKYRELAVLRNPLKTSFTLALSVIWLLSVLSAVWIAFVSARKLVSPIIDLVEGTRSVAAGVYDRHLKVSGDDELGLLMRSFNTMTRQISRARRIAEKSKLMEARQRNYLESVMEHIASGVLTIDNTGLIKRGNPAACTIFGIETFYFTEINIDDVLREYPMMQAFFDVVRNNMPSEQQWHEEIVIFGQSGRKILRVTGARLESQTDDRQEQVIVVDDLTELIQAQKNSAWSEMARRMAHEIKNPLTPIQLSAERLQRKLSGEVVGNHRSMLDRYTRTIVQQVEAMKTMVNAFTEYARSPSQNPGILNLNDLLEDISVLYHENYTEVTIELELDSSIPQIMADSVRLRQLVHNLIKNSLDSIDTDGWIKLSTRGVQTQSHQYLELVVEDSGNGIADEVAENLFEPYVTTKITGGGLGLAIVKKIVDEHSGIIWVEDGERGGARFVIRLPAISQKDDKLQAGNVRNNDAEVMP
jgi:PAS domain S-box-containing protein